jgi:hypothetical protein
MGKKINLEKTEFLEIEAFGMVLTVHLEKGTGRILSTVESAEGGQTIRIAPHESLKNTIFFAIDKPRPGLRIVK